MKVKSIDKKEEVALDEWIVDENTGEKTMYSRLQDIPFCKVHKFGKDHQCTKCPYIFIGFMSHKHIQKADGIFDRQTGKKIK